MTTRITVTNHSQKHPVQGRREGQDLGTIAPGQTSEFHVWNGAPITFRELEAPKEEPASEEVPPTEPEPVSAA